MMHLGPQPRSYGFIALFKWGFKCYERWGEEGGVIWSVRTIGVYALQVALEGFVSLQSEKKNGGGGAKVLSECCLCT